MSQNTYSKPSIYINDTEITEFSGFTINEPGNNQINSADVTGIRKDLVDFTLMNQELVIYLNEGSTDSVPIFRGIIVQISPGTTDMAVKARDPRAIISGRNAFPIVVDDTSNYDGFTLIQFIHEYIRENINSDSSLKPHTKIGLDYLQETNPTLLMKGFRTELAVPYQIMQDSLRQALDITDIENPKDFEIIMIDDGVKSNIAIQKKKDLTTTVPSVYYDLTDGIKSINYTYAGVPTFALIKGEKEVQSKYQDGNMATGKRGVTISGEYNSRAVAQFAGLIEIARLQDTKISVSLVVNKGFHLDIGSVVNIYINDNVNDSFELSANHRVSSKSIKYSTTTGPSMTLKLNSKPLRVSDFIN